MIKETICLHMGSQVAEIVVNLQYLNLDEFSINVSSFSPTGQSISLFV